MLHVGLQCTNTFCLFVFYYLGTIEKTIPSPPPSLSSGQSYKCSTTYDYENKMSIDSL